MSEGCAGQKHIRAWLEKIGEGGMGTDRRLSKTLGSLRATIPGAELESERLEEL